MHRAGALALIRRLALDSGCIFPWPHARSRMHTRQIDDLQLQRCLSSGVIVEGPYRAIATRRWRCNVRANVSGDLITAVVEIPEEGTHLEVVTVF